MPQTAAEFPPESPFALKIVAENRKGGLAGSSIEEEEEEEEEALKLIAGEARGSETCRLARGAAIRIQVRIVPLQLRGDEERGKVRERERKREREKGT